jgi:WD40 repeat protein
MRSTGMVGVEATAGSPARPWLLPERHIVTLGGPVTGLCVADKEVGSSEVAVMASTDGTITLCRTNTGEIVRMLRGPRGESIESFRIPTMCARNPTMRDAETEELTGGRAKRRPAGPPRSYAADAVSRRLAPMSDLAVVRRPVYTIHAYRDEVRDVFAGPSNGFFHGLRAVAPTYAHLAPHENTVADVLAAFGIPASTTPGNTAAAAAAAAPTTPRQWYASTVAVGVAPDTRRSAHPVPTADAGSARDLYLFLGFPEGLMQVYVLPRRWFQLHLHGETRLDPPHLRFPILSAAVHTTAVLLIEVMASKDLVVSVGEDGTTQLRRLSVLEAPLRQLGACVIPMSPTLAPTAGPLPPFTDSSQVVAAGAVSLGHRRSVTCCCVDAAHQLLVTGSSDHTLCWWSLMAGSPPSPFRVLSLRDAASNLPDAASITPAASSPPTLHSGYPIDVSFFYRRRDGDGDIYTNSSTGGGGSSGGVSPANSPAKDMFLLVLDTEQVVRIFDAFSGKLCLAQAEESTATALAPSTGDVRVRHSVRLVRYDGANGADRLLLGGLSLVPWYLTPLSECSVVDGHKEPILFSAWSTALRCVVTADAHHALLWRLGVPLQDAGSLSATTAKEAAGTTSCRSDDNCVVDVLRAWNVPLGVRSIALCEGTEPDGTSAESPSLLIATLEQPLLVQYDCLAENPFQTSASSAHSVRGSQLREPLPLRHLALCREEAHTTPLPDVAALAAVATRSDHGIAHADAAESTSKAYACALCHHGDSQGSVLVYALRDQVAGVPVTNSSSVDRVFPVREIHPSQKNTRTDGEEEGGSNNGDVVSVLPVPAHRLLVLGGRRTLYVTSLFGSSSSAAPCTSLPTVPPSNPPGSRRSGAGSSSLSPSVAAVFPGPLVCSDGTGVIWRRGRSDYAGAANDQSSAVMASSTASLGGYLSRLAYIEGDVTPSGDAAPRQPAAPCLILSGSNVGVIQLWDAQRGAELWRCAVSLSQEPITALAAQRCAARWLVAVGDQVGVVTVLDITEVVRAAERRAVASAACVGDGRWASVSVDARLQAATEAFMIDRWQAHADAVSSLCFAGATWTKGGEEGQRLITTGGETSVVVWTLPLLLSKRFGCVKTGRRLFERRISSPLCPRLTALSWVTRDVYVKLQECYVRECLFDQCPELLPAFAALYSQSVKVEAHVKNEESLLDRAWGVLVADAHALLIAVQGDSQVSAAPLNEMIVREWCVSLLAAPPPSSLSVSMAIHSASSCGTASSSGGLSPTFSLVFAFADRCCGADPRLRHTAKRPAVQSGRRTVVSSSSVVRECLCSAVRAVVQTSTALRVSPSPLPSSARESPVLADICTSSTAPATARPAVELFSAVATVAALTRLPVPGSGATAVSTPLRVGVTSTSVPPPLPVEAAASCGGGGPCTRPSVVASALPPPPATTNPTLPSSRQVLFDEGTQQNNSCKESVAVDQITRDSSPEKGYRVMYGSLAPLVRGAPAIPEAVFSQAESGGAVSAVFRHVATQPDTLVNSSAAHEGVASAAEQHFVEHSASETSASDYDDGNNVRAAAVVERVHRSRRRHGDALQLLSAQASAEETSELFPVAKSAVKANRRLTRESTSRYVIVKDACRTLVEDDPPHAAAARDHHLTQSNRGDACTAAMSSAQAARPVVADTYLAPTLARVRADAIHVSGKARECSTSTLQMSWYAMRQRKRDIAEEKARLWNTSRVMRTLMAWRSTERVNSVPDRCYGTFTSVQRPAQVTGGTAADVIEQLASSPRLTLPDILAFHTPSVPPQGIDGGKVTEVRRFSNDFSASVTPPSCGFPALLHVSPTAAIDAAVHPGLPTRETLRREMAAMQARMRQSVQQRAIQQRLQRAEAVATTAPMTVQRGSSVAARAGRETVSGGTMIDRVGGTGEDDSDGGVVDDVASETRGSTPPSPNTAVLSVPSSSQSAATVDYSSLPTSTTAIAAASSPQQRQSLAKQHGRGLRSNDGLDARWMTTVPLPNATTRRDLFAGHGVGLEN